MTKTSELLRTIPLFAGLDVKKLAALSEVVIRRKYPRKTVLFSKGDESNLVYFVVRGSASAVISDENGREIILNQIAPGDVFGEFALLDGKPRSTSVITREATEVMLIRREDFKHLLLSEADVMCNLMMILLAKLNDATEIIEGLSLYNVYCRITRLLLRLADVGDNGLEISERPTHREIAGMVGASREMVSKIMKQLVDGGYVAIDGRRLRIVKRFPRQF